MRSHFSFAQPDAGQRAAVARTLDGGALMDVGCYCVSAARLVVRRRAGGVRGLQRAGDEVDLGFTGTMRFPGDVLAHFDCGMNAANRAELEVVGSEGTLVVRDPFHSRDVGIELDGERVEVEFRDPYLCEVEALADPPFGREDAVGQARAIAALYAAAG